MREAEMGMNGKDDEVTCKEREQCKTNVEVGPELVQSDVPKDVQDTSYGPWVVVARKKKWDKSAQYWWGSRGTANCTRVKRKR